MLPVTKLLLNEMMCLVGQLYTNCGKNRWCDCDGLMKAGLTWSRYEAWKRYQSQSHSVGSHFLWGFYVSWTLHFRKHLGICIGEEWRTDSAGLENCLAVSWGTSFRKGIALVSSRSRRGRAGLLVESYRETGPPLLTPPVWGWLFLESELPKDSKDCHKGCSPGESSPDGWLDPSILLPASCSPHHQGSRSEIPGSSLWVE